MTSKSTLQYLFDLNGYIILENVLTEEEVNTLNRLIDKQNLPKPGLTTESARFGSNGLVNHHHTPSKTTSDEMGQHNSAGFLEWGKEFCNLLDHDRVLEVLGWVLGDGFRIDHFYGIYMKKGTEGLRLHGGATPYDPPEYFHYHQGELWNGLTVVSYNLTDTGHKSGGGFVCVPGSHKSNYPVPDEFKNLNDKAPIVINPEVKAGSVVIFTEALTHGTAPWRADKIRRSLLFKYSPGQQSWSHNYPPFPKNVELTERQKILFEKPYFQSRPSLFTTKTVSDIQKEKY